MSKEDEPEKLYKTFSHRIKDATSRKRLICGGNAVNTVWNFLNDVSAKSARRDPKKWINKAQLRALTNGSSKLIGLPSQVIQEVIDEFIKCRKAARRSKLRWRVSRGAKRSLGWVPFTNQDVVIVSNGVASFRGDVIRFWQHRDICGPIKSGSFAQNARGHWYLNIVVEVARPEKTNRTTIVGMDLGFKTVAAACNAPDLEQTRFYRDLEPKLAEAQRQGRKRQVRSIHAKIANRRKDALHKYSRTIVGNAGAVFVGNISSTWQIKSNKAKATLDMSWSTLRNILKYKCDHAGVAFAEVDERYTTQICSCCGSTGGPKGREELGVRQWVCGDCDTVHDRDLNAAINIARRGCATLGLKWPGSPLQRAEFLV